jgi:hypothetical protein
MSAVLLAVFNDYESARRARLELVRDGFPTDRVELTAVCEPGRAACFPAEDLRGKFVQYFRILFKAEADRQYAESLAERLDGGAAATITVHPRGTIETNRATKIIESASPAEVVHRNLRSRWWGFAAAQAEQPWIRHVWLEKSDAHCIYCRLFESMGHMRIWS